MNKKYQLPYSWESEISRKLSRLKLGSRVLKTQADKMESFESWADHAGYNNAPRFRKQQARSDNVVRVLSFPEITPSGKIEMIKEFDYSHNLVTDDGEIYYAHKGANEALAALSDFGVATSRFDMGTTAYAENETDKYNEYDVSGTSSISGSILGFESGYPQTNDTGDADNTGDAVDAVSYAINYSAASWNDTTVEQGCIHEGGATPGTTDPMLAVFSFTSFAKTASDTLKVFVNHAFENQT